MRTGVYRIRNEINGKVYIGSTSQKRGVLGRFIEHRVTLNRGTHCNRYLQRAWDKYGKEAFTFKGIEYCEQEKCTEREQYWIDAYESYKPEKGYNLLAKAHSSLGFKHSEETKALLSKLHVGKKLTEEQRKRKSEIMKEVCKNRNYRHSAETRAKISAKNKGKDMSKAMEAARAVTRGKKLSPTLIEYRARRAKEATYSRRKEQIDRLL